MSETSSRFAFAILVGIVLNLAFTLFLQIACWGPLISVVVAGYLARATTSKNGVIIGSLVFLPSTVVLVTQSILQSDAINEIGLPLTILAGVLGVATGIGIGGLFGLAVGKLLEFLKDRIVF